MFASLLDWQSQFSKVGKTMELGFFPAKSKICPIFEFFTVRKWNWGKVMFYTCLSVILFTEGCLPQCMLGYTHTSLGRIPQQTSPCADTPLCRHPPVQTPPWADTPWQTPPAQCMLDMATTADSMHPTGMHSCTGWERLIQSHSSARFCFELRGNSN